MSVLFSELTLTATWPDESIRETRLRVSGHPTKEEIRDSEAFARFCEDNPQAVAVIADVRGYIFGHAACGHDADEDHLKLMAVYEEDCGLRFVDRTNVSLLKHATHYYLPPFGTGPCRGNGGKKEETCHAQS